MNGNVSGADVAHTPQKAKRPGVPNVEFRIIEGRPGKRRRSQWRVQVRRCGRILLVSEYHTRRRNLEAMLGKLVLALSVGRYTKRYVTLKGRQ